MIIWSEKYLKYKGLPRPYFYTSRQFHYKDNKRFLANKAPVPYQSLPGNDTHAIGLNISNEEEVIENNLCPYCGNTIKEDEVSIRWTIEKENIDYSKDVVPSDFYPFHLECMKQGRIFCPFMRTLVDNRFDIDINKNNLIKSKENIKKYFNIDWKNRPR